MKVFYGGFIRRFFIESAVKLILLRKQTEQKTHGGEE
jgi:hypothetical protein